MKRQSVWRAAGLLVVLCLLAGCFRLGTEEAEMFSPEALQSFLYEMMERGETEATVQYASENLDQETVDNAIRELTKRDGGFIYLVDEVQWAYVEHLGYGELRITLHYKEGTRPLAELPVVRTPLEAAEAAIASLEAGEHEIVLFVEDATWSMETAYAIAAAAQNNALVSCAFDSYTYSLMPEWGEDRVLDITFNSDVSAQMQAERREELLSMVEQTAAEITALDLPTEREQYLAVHDAVIDRAEYDTALADAVQLETAEGEANIARSAYGALVSGRTVCSGYAYAFRALCDQLGLPCWVVEGTYEGVGHSWNLVRLEGKSYYVDCTGDDATGDKTFFLFTEQDPQWAGYEPESGGIVPW